MIDIHCHMLPNIDDGPKDMEEALKMARIAVEDGIHTTFATPHCFEDEINGSGEFLQETVKAFNEKLKEENIPLEVLVGSEIYICPELPQYIKDKEHFKMNGSKYLLIEFPLNDLPLYVEDVIYELQLLGITPIIAHPERYAKVIENPSILYDFINQGALVQINGGSLLGKFGPKVQTTCEILLKHNQVHFIGSDGHSLRSRKPKLRDAIKRASEIVGREEAIKLVRENTLLVIQNEEVYPPEPIKIAKERKKTFIKFLPKFLRDKRNHLKDASNENTYLHR